MLQLQANHHQVKHPQLNGSHAASPSLILLWKHETQENIYLRYIHKHKHKHHPLYLHKNTGLDLNMKFLCILQPRRGLVPPRVVGSSHLFSYGRRGGIRAETSSTMFSTGRGKGKGKDKVFGK